MPSLYEIFFAFDTLEEQSSDLLGVKNKISDQEERRARRDINAGNIFSVPNDGDGKRD